MADFVEVSTLKSGLMTVSIGNTVTETSSWTVDPIANTWTRNSEDGTQQDPVELESNLELVGIGLNDETESPLANVYVHGDYALVGGMSIGYSDLGNVGVRILDISDPTSPELVGRIPLRNRQVNELHSHGDALATRIDSEAFEGDIAIVGHGVPDSYKVEEYPMPFGIWDISEPANPEFLSVVSQGHFSWMHETGDLGDKPEDAKAVHGNTPRKRTKRITVC